MATSGPGRRLPNTCTSPPASRTRRVPWRMKRRSRLDNRRMWELSAIPSPYSNESESGHAAPDEAALNYLTESGGFCEVAWHSVARIAGVSATSLKPDCTKLREGLRSCAAMGIVRGRDARSFGRGPEAKKRYVPIGHYWRHGAI